MADGHAYSSGEEEAAEGGRHSGLEVVEVVEDAVERLDSTREGLGGDRAVVVVVAVAEGAGERPCRVVVLAEREVVGEWC